MGLCNQPFILILSLENPLNFILTIGCDIISYMSERPFRLLQRDINTVKRGENPSLDLKTLLQITGLDEPTPRDCAFLFRFGGKGNSRNGDFGDISPRPNVSRGN